MQGTSAAVCLLPTSNTGIVVLQNSLGLSDTTEWTCQLIIDALFTGSLQNNNIALVVENSKNVVAKMQKVKDALERDRIPGINPVSMNC